MLSINGNRQEQVCKLSQEKDKYSIKSITARENEAIFLNILLPKRKTKLSRFLKDLNDSFLKLKTFDSEIKVLGNFNINLFLDGRYIIDKSL